MVTTFVGETGDRQRFVHRGSFMSGHVLLNLLNKLGGGGGR